MKQKHIQDSIEEQYKARETEISRHKLETKKLQSNLEEDSDILEQFKQVLEQRDASIENLRIDIKEGLKASLNKKDIESQNNEDASRKLSEEIQSDKTDKENSETLSPKTEAKPLENADSSTVEEVNLTELRKCEVLLQAAEKENDHLMQIYSIFTERIEVQRELNKVLRNFAYSWLFFLQEDESSSLQLQNGYKEYFLSALRLPEVKEPQESNSQDFLTELVNTPQDLEKN